MKENKKDERSHKYYMKICIELALVAKARGDSAVKAVLVQDGSIIARGIEEGKAGRISLSR